MICLLSKGFFSVSAKAFDIPAGDKKEMLCVPMQQMARVCSLRSTDGEGRTNLTPEQYETAAELLTPEGIQRKQPNWLFEKFFYLLYRIVQSPHADSSFRSFAALTLAPTNPRNRGCG